MLQQTAAALLLLSLSATSSFAGIGSVEKQTGIADLFRSKEKIAVKQDLGVEMNDDIRTGNGTVKIGFDDKTKVQVEKHSKLVIDDFVYDSSKPTASKLGLKIALGTVKYASGLIAKNNRQSVNISTPTARIGVLGTSFSMTVDEIGKSLIILLPNPDGSIGQISVESDAGQVILNQAFQATVVGSLEAKPTRPVLLDLTEAQINNLLIIKKPKEKEIDEDGSNGDKNFLEFNELDINYLDENSLDSDNLSFTQLDFNLLDVDFLQNILDALNKRILEETETFPKNPIKAGVYEQGNAQIYNDGTSWVIYRQFDGRIAEVTVGESSQTQIQLNQAGNDVTLHTQEDASDSVIIINQN